MARIGLKNLDPGRPIRTLVRPRHFEKIGEVLLTETLPVQAKKTKDELLFCCPKFRERSYVPLQAC